MTKIEDFKAKTKKLHEVASEAIYGKNESNSNELNADTETESTSVIAESDSTPVEPASVIAEPDSTTVESTSVIAESDSTTVEPASVVAESDSTTVEPASVVAESDSTTVEPASVIAEPDSTMVEPASVIVGPDSTTVKPASVIAGSTPAVVDSAKYAFKIEFMIAVRRSTKLNEDLLKEISNIATDTKCAILRASALDGFEGEFIIFNGRDSLSGLIKVLSDGDLDTCEKPVYDLTCLFEELVEKHNASTQVFLFLPTDVDTSFFKDAEYIGLEKEFPVPDGYKCVTLDS